MRSRICFSFVALGLLVVGIAIPVAGQAADLFNNTNTQAVINGPSNGARFVLKAPARISQLITYHWNFGHGAQPGEIGLRRVNGPMYGPFNAIGTSAGQAQNVNWIANVDILVPAGQYEVVDTDPSTWSTNADSGFQGFAIVRGSLLLPSSPQDRGSGDPDAPPQPLPSASPAKSSAVATASSSSTSQADSVTAADLVGVWDATGYTCNQPIPVEVIKITANGNRLTAVKITGDPCVPAGEITWEGVVSGGVISGRYRGNFGPGTPINWYNGLGFRVVDRQTLEGTLAQRGMTYHRQKASNQDASLRFVRQRDGKFEEIKTLYIGNDFYIEAKFPLPQTEPQRDAELEWQGQPDDPVSIKGATYNRLTGTWSGRVTLSRVPGSDRIFRAGPYGSKAGP